MRLCSLAFVLSIPHTLVIETSDKKRGCGELEPLEPIDARTKKKLQTTKSSATSPINLPRVQHACAFVRRTCNAHATGMHRTCNTQRTCSWQHASRTEHATNFTHSVLRSKMQHASTCTMHKIYMQRTCNAHATRNVHATCMRRTCN